MESVRTDKILGTSIYITLKECDKLPNVWYYDHLCAYNDNLFMLTAKGFVLKAKGSKSKLAEHGFIR